MAPMPLDKDRALKRLQKKAKRGMRGWPAATIAFYGPDATRATKVAVGIVTKDGGEPIEMRDWSTSTGDVRNNAAIATEILGFIEKHGALTVITSDGIIGCPHQTGIDYEGDWCPDHACTYWYKRDRFTGEMVPDGSEEGLRYDADQAPDPKEWLELDEQERIDLVIDYHKRAKKQVGEAEKLHAIAHVIVESQVAIGDATVVLATLARLMREGLDRHNAIHAIANVLMGIVLDVLKGRDKQVDINEKYGRELGELTAASWRSQ
jgi:hypothetical protein